MENNINTAVQVSWKRPLLVERLLDPVIFLIIFIVLLVIALVILLSFFRPAKTGKIAENLYAVRNIFVNFYVLNTASGVVLFDCGTSPRRALKGLADLGISPQLVTHIFLTHSDTDHQGGLEAFPDANRYISAAEEQMITGRVPRSGHRFNRPIPNYQILQDGQALLVGGHSVRIFVTPGHTLGSAVYLVDGRILVSGDLLKVTRQGDISPFLHLLNMNNYEDSQNVTALLPVIDRADMVLSGHTGVYQGQSEADEKTRQFWEGDGVE